MTELIDPVRAKTGYLEATRKDKAGRTVKARDHVIVSEGLYSAKEMERAMIEVAAEVGVDESAIRIETYAKGESPIEVNPRHRGTAKNYEKPKVHDPRAVILSKRVWGGFGNGIGTRPLRED